MKFKNVLTYIIVLFTVLNLSFSVNATGIKKNTYNISCGKKIIINTKDIFGAKSDKYTFKILNSQIISVKKSGTKFVIAGKKVGISTLELYNGDKKYTITCIVSPKNFSLQAPNVEVYTSTYIKNKLVHYVSWSKIKGATGYKIYRINKDGKKTLIKKISKSDVTEIYVHVNHSTSSLYYIQAYKKYNGKVYYGKGGYNTSTNE